MAKQSTVVSFIDTTHYDHPIYIPDHGLSHLFSLLIIIDEIIGDDI